MGALPAVLRPEADQLESQVRKLLRERYNKPIVGFEHGPSAPKHGTGCGVDHAHLHLVPLDCDLRSGVVPFLPVGQEWLPSGWIEREAAFRCGLDYLYLKEDEVAGLIAVSRDFGSQVFRKAIAEHFGRANQFNWRDNPELETVSCTINAFRECDNEHVA